MTENTNIWLNGIMGVVVGDALGCPDLLWAANDAVWKETSNGHASSTGLQSAAIGDDAVTEISVTVFGPGNVSFWWKTSCQYDNLGEYYYDHAEVWIDGTRIAMLDGESEWLKVEHSIVGEGAHTILWRYVKDGNVSVGSDCLWLSDMRWSGAVISVVEITLNANGGTCATASINVKHGATPELPSANKAGLSFDGWFTKAVGGDKITNETEILRNIGTLYAQFVDASLIVETAQTISDTREVPDLYVTTTGALTITGDVTANNFILESNGSTASGQFVAGYENLHYTHAYFDLKINAKNHQWYAVAVPWNVDAETGISVNGKTLVLGKDFDIVYYDGERRAAEGKQKCWSYVEDDVDKTLVPGRLYMIGLMGDAAVVRFEKKDGAALSTTTTSVEAHPQTTGTATDAGWNGVANPALFHAFVNPGVTEGQVYVPDEKRYETVPLNTTKFVVGEGAFVQVESGKSISVAKDGAFAAPRRTRAQANLTYDVRIAPVEEEYTDTLCKV